MALIQINEILKLITQVTYPGRLVSVCLRISLGCRADAESEAN